MSSTNTAPQTFARFIAVKYEKSKLMHERVNQPFAISLDSFAETYVASQGFSDWLETLRDQSLSLAFCINTAKQFCFHGKRHFREIPGILASLSRTYNIEWPVVEGLYTARYWADTVLRLNWGEILIDHEGDSWRALSFGSEGAERMSCRLASTTRTLEQAGADAPLEINAEIAHHQFSLARLARRGAEARA